MNSNGSFIFFLRERQILTKSYHWPVLFLIFISIIGIIGNLLVCLAIATERRLHNRTNWFLFSLALADMIVSSFVIPLAIVKDFIGSWILGTILCDLWIFLDVCSCTSSIMHIVVISIDRYLAIKDPLNVRSRQEKYQICLLISLIWIIAIFLSSPLLVLAMINPSNIIINGQCLINNQFFLIYGSVVSFVIPLIIVIVIYALTVHRLKKQIKQCQSQFAREEIVKTVSQGMKPLLRRQRLQETNFDCSEESLSNLSFERYPFCHHRKPGQSYSVCSYCRERANSCRKSRPVSLPSSSSLNINSIKRPWRRLTLTPSLASTRKKSSAVRNEQKAVKVLGVVFVIFVIAWFPFCILNLLQGFCPACKIDEHMLNGFVWLGYVSSSINPLVYTIFNRNFRLKFLALLKCQCLCSDTRQRQLSNHSSSYGSRSQRRNGLIQNDIRRLNAAHRKMNESSLV